MKTITLILGLALLLGCATSYQQKGLTGGFSETQLSENIYRVDFRGNAYTSRERAIDFTLLRSAELALENGYNYFLIVDEQSWDKHASYTTPTQSRTTVNAHTYGTYYGNSIHGTYSGNTYGTATTTTSGGQTFLFSKPRTSNTIICLKEAPEDEGMVFDAEFVSQSIWDKYDLDSLSNY